MDAAEAVLLKALSRLKEGTQAVIDRGDSPVQQFYHDTTVFVTGGSGFLGKQLIEKLFRSCKIRKVYMLMRSKKKQTVEERLTEVLKDPLYDTLHQDQPGFAERIVPIVGDVSEQDLGISDKDKHRIIEEVTVIFHVAATISFQEPLRAATFTNVRGTRDLLLLAKRCKKIRSFVYTSTAYTHATFSKRNSEILEQFYPSPISPHLMIEMAENLDENRLNGIKDGLTKDWPNTYSFTKALAEELLQTSAGDLPVCVIRPTVVMCARREPYAGWIDKSSVLGPNGIILGSMMGVIHALHTDQNIKIDFIPVDYVTNVAIAAAATSKDSVKIFTVGSSCRNYITWGGLSNILNNVARRTIVSPQAMWYCFVLQTTNRWRYRLYSYFLHNIPAHIVDRVCVLLKKPPRLKKIYATVNKMGNIISYYTNNHWIFNDKNTLELYNNLSESDKIIYHCDISDVDWTEQILLWSVGTRKYVVKDGLTNTEWAMKKQVYYKITTYVISGVVIYFVLLLFCYLFLFLKVVFDL